MPFDFTLSFCAGMFFSFSLAFGCSFYLFFFLFWNILVDCCAELFFYINTTSSSPVFQVGYMTRKRVLRMVTTQRNAPRTIKPQHRYQDSSHSVSVQLWQAWLHGFHLRCWTCLGGWENVPFVASLVFLLLLPIDLANCCRNLYGFNAVLLCNRRFWDSFTSVTLASL